MLQAALPQSLLLGALTDDLTHQQELAISTIPLSYNLQQ